MVLSARVALALALLSWAACFAVPAPALSERVVASPAGLYAAVDEANRAGTVSAIVLLDGSYRLTRPLRITADGLTIRSASGVREQVVLRGNGMRKTARVDNLIEVNGSRVSLVGLTLAEAGNHLVQLRGERDADHFRLINCVLRDAYQQLLKVTSERDGEPSADFGVIRGSSFEYTADRGPNYYIGGVDLHSGKRWRIEGNSFRNIASPAGRVAEHAIHIWKNSADNVVRNNLIINSDRGIGFGLTRDWFRHNRGGEISGNVIVHTRPSDPFADVGIALENSPGTVVRDNVVFLGHGYPNAIEYRFPDTEGVVISGNTTNKAITGRDGARALVEGNVQASLGATAMDYLRRAFSRLGEQSGGP
jgi:hypothetical protein